MLHFGLTLRAVVAVSALLAGLLTIPALPQTASADTGCPTPAGSYSAGAGTAVSPWQISTAGDLQRLRDDSITGWDDSFILTANIDMGACTWTKTIGNGTTAFTGLLDGAGFTISGLSVTVAETATSAYAGLVGRLASPGKLTRIGFTGAVSASATTGSTKFSYAGGLVGYAQVGSTVSYSYATGSTSAYVSLGSPFSSAYAYAGGLAGRLDGTITDSYATGVVSATGGTGEKYMYAGGLIGFSTASASRAYSTGAPTATASTFDSLAGGFVGQTNGGTLTGNLWDVTSSGKANGAGPGTFSGMAGKSTTQMQQFATYDDSSWPIVNGWQPFDVAASKVWGICNGSTRAFLLWQYSASPCSAAPGAPTVTGVTAAATSASVAFTADDSGGATILSIQYALDDTTGIDGAAANASPLHLTGLASGTPYTVYIRAVNVHGPSPWSAASSFATLPVPPPPVPASAPVDVRATAADSAAIITWAAPTSTGSFPVTTYQATASPGGRSCMTATTSCTIDGLRNGTSYTVAVRALNGAGWSADSTPSNAVVPRASATKVLTISGSRGTGAQRGVIRVSGTSSGLVGEQVTVWLSIAGGAATPSSTRVQITQDGTFSWSRKLNRAAIVYAEAQGIRSNTVDFGARR